MNQEQLTAYRKHIESKIDIQESGGFVITPDEFHPSSANYPHQFDTARWALGRGRALLALSFGLHKTAIQLQMMRCIHNRTGGKTLIVCPLGAKHQFTKKDGPRLGMDVQYVTCDAEALATDTPYLITNYERLRDGDITQAFVHGHITGASLDEGDTLRSLGSKTYNVFCDLFAPVPYRFVATATPDPNGYLEMVNYAVFLGVAERSACLNRYFGRNVDKAGDLQLYPHREEEFWLWVSSWALFVTKPGDLGYDDSDFDLPEMQVHWHRIPTDHERAWEIVDNRGQRNLIMDSAGGITQAMKEKRNSLNGRVQKMLALMAQPSSDAPDSQWIIWCHLNDEQRAIEVALKERGISVSSIHGALSLDESERRLFEWLDKETTVLLSKPVILGAGVNLQQCHRAVFLGVDYKFKDFIQAIHRIQRFGQEHKVDIGIIHTDAEDGVVNVLKRKWQDHDVQVAKMTDIIRRYGLIDEALRSELQRSLGVNREVAKGDYFTAVNNDCVLEMMSLDDNSVDHICSSIPFSTHYGYVNAYEDFGHNENDDKFFEQMDHLTPHLLRVLKPGRVAAIHVKDLLRYGHASDSGILEVVPFSDMTVFHFRKHGFVYEGRITIVTDVVRENSTTYRLGWTEQCKDGSKMGVGMPEYVLLFRKAPTDRTTAYADDPVVKDKATYARNQWQIDAHSFWRSSGNRLLTPEDVANLKTSDIYRWWKDRNLTTVYDYQEHLSYGEHIEANGRLPSGFMLFPTQSWAANVWADVDFMRSLNLEQARNRQENHVCPLAFDVVERLINRFTNPNDLVLDPFHGLGTTSYIAVRSGRRGYGVELNPDYWRWSKAYLEEAEIKRNAPTLFDLDELAVPQGTNGKPVNELEAT